MKKLVIPVLLLLAAFFIFRAFTRKPEAAPKPAKPDPISLGSQSATFTTSFTALLDAYYQMKDAFVAANTAAIDKSAALLKIAADSLHIDSIKGDTAGTIRETARYFAGSISVSAATLSTQKDLENKRREFDGLTDAVWNLTRTVRYDGGKIYYQYCPMAFNNKGAYWLSKDKKISNPYYGSKMPGCGEIADSIDYRN